jgi:poly(3-hydroxybutyrate) depolymerase
VIATVKAQMQREARFGETTTGRLDMAFQFKRGAVQLLASVILLVTSLGAAAQVQPGPGTWSDKQTWAADSVNGDKLTGYFYWPASEPALAGKRALVLVLHGCAQTAWGDVIDSASDAGFNWKPVADQYGALILAPNATGDVYDHHCWDWANTDHRRDQGHDGILLDLVRRFVRDPQYAIDPNQVYVAGLSSGGAETMVLGCLAPDVFAGVGINAGPPPGVSTWQIGFVPLGFDAATAGAKCRSLAGSHAADFASQVASVVWGTSDFMVAPSYGPLDAAAMRYAYGGDYSRGPSKAVPDGGSYIPYVDADGKLRTSEMAVNDMRHAWPAGHGGQNSNYVDGTRVNYPAYVMDFWFRNNLRVALAEAPRMTSCAATVSASTVTVSGSATDSAGPIASYRVVLDGPVGLADTAAGSGASFSKAYANIAHGYYTGTVTANGSGTELASSPCAIAEFLVGTAPALRPPGKLTVAGTTPDSIRLSWRAVEGATGYRVYRDGERVTITPVTTTTFTDAGLAASTRYSYRVTSVDVTGPESPRSAAVTGITGSAFTCSATRTDNHAHVSAGRAYDSGGRARAIGSDQDMGLDNVIAETTLAQTAPGYYVIGGCR